MTRATATPFWLLLALAGNLAACGRDKTDDGLRSAAPEGARPAAKFRIVLPPPTPNGPQATLTVGLSGEHIARVRGADDIAVEGGEAVAGRKRAFRLRAHETELQRLQIGGAAVLVRVPPGAEMRLADQPCFGWELAVPWLDSHLHATLPDADGNCSERSIKQLADYRCPAGAEADGHCCFSKSVLSFAGAGDALRAVTGPGGGTVELRDDETIEVVAGGCGFYEAETANDKVNLAIGFGKRWQIDIDERGIISGRVLP